MFIQPEALAGKLKGFPVIICYALMLEQYLQGNPPNLEVFIKELRMGKADGGFNWMTSKFGSNTWARILWPENAEPNFKTLFDNLDYAVR